MKAALAKKWSIQPEKTIEEASLSFDGKKLVFVFENGEGYVLDRTLLPFDDGTPVTRIEIFDHGCAVAIYQASGHVYDLPWDSIKHYAQGGKQSHTKFGTRLAFWRKRKKITQEELARRANLSRIQIARIETNQSEPTLGTLEKIANALNVTLGQLIAP